MSLAYKLHFRQALLLETSTSSRLPCAYHKCNLLNAQTSVSFATNVLTVGLLEFHLLFHNYIVIIFSHYSKKRTKRIWRTRRLARTRTGAFWTGSLDLGPGTTFPHTPVTPSILILRPGHCNDYVSNYLQLNYLVQQLVQANNGRHQSIALLALYWR